MAKKNKRVLIVASLEISREAALIVSKILKEGGYSPVFCHSGSEDVNISEDRILEIGMSVTDIAGVVVIDNGGNQEAAVSLISTANKKGIVIGVLQAGCIVAKESKVYKNRYLCSGLPEDYYKGAKKTNAPCVRSGNLITCSGECVEGFANLVVGALGGKSKSIITSSPASKEVIQACEAGKIMDNLSYLFDMGKKFEESDINGITKKGSKSTAIFPFETKRIIGIDDFAIIAGNNSHRVVGKEELVKLLKGSRISNCGLIFEGKEAEISIIMNKSVGGWETYKKEAFLNGHPASIENVLSSGTSEEKENFILNCEKMSHQTCLLIESSLSKPENFNSLQVYFSSQNNDPKLIRISSFIVSSIDTVEPKASGKDGERELLIRKKLLEREMGVEGIFIQPDGSIGIDLIDEQKKLDQWEAVRLLTKLAIKANNEVKRLIKTYGIGSTERKRMEAVSLAARHKLRVLLSYLQVSKLIKSSEVDIEGVNGWYSNLDLPMKERVFEYSEDEQDFMSNDKWIKSQPRYNPEYEERGDPNGTCGFYYTWWEIANSPYYYSRILEEGIYPMSSQYKGIGVGKN